MGLSIRILFFTVTIFISKATGQNVNAVSTGTACTVTDPLTGLSVQGTCFDATFAQSVCPLFGSTVSAFSTCTGTPAQACCYVATSTGTGTPSPGNAGNNVCGVSLQGRQNPLDSGLGTGSNPFDSGVVLPRDAPVRFSRILGGTSVQDMNRYCWIAAIYAGNNYIASGAIVNSNWIVTSANAVKSYRNPNPYVTTQTLTVRLGQISLANGLATGQYQVQSIQLHPSFRLVAPGYPVGDVALLQLATAIDFSANPSLCGACLPEPNQSIVGERCHAAGYGVTVETSAITDGQLRSVLLPFIPRPVCDLLYRQVLRNTAYTTDLTSMCAGGEVGRDTCLKDGGAPLSCVSLTRPYYVVAGLSSWGNGCGRSGVPSVYTDLSSQAVLLWIRKVAGSSFPAPQQLTTGVLGS